MHRCTACAPVVDGEQGAVAIAADLDRDRAAPGRAAIADRVGDKIVDRLAKLGEVAGHPGLEQLTGREREVLLGIARGRTNKEIAAELGISHRTVETHRESLMRKLQIRTVAELTRFAISAGIVPT